MAKKKKAKRTKQELQYPLLVRAIVNHTSNTHITNEHAYEMEKIMRENNERFSDRKLASWLHEHALDNVPAEYELLNSFDKAAVDKALKQEAKDLAGC